MSSKGTITLNRSLGNYCGFPVLNIGDVFYPNGLGLDTPASITYSLASLSNPAALFVSDIGIDKDSYGSGSAMFPIWADQVKLLQTRPVTATSTVQTLTVDIRGRQTLKLATTGSGNADWGERADAPQPALSIQISEGNVILNRPEGMQEQADVLEGIWSPSCRRDAALHNALISARGCYRLKLQ